MEQQYPVLYRRYALHEGSGGAGPHRGGFGLDYEVELLRGTARASFVMDHGRFGPQGALGGRDGGVNRVEVIRGGETLIPEHLSKAQDIPLAPGDRVRVRTPGGGGYGDPAQPRPRRWSPRTSALAAIPRRRPRRASDRSRRSAEAVSPPRVTIPARRCHASCARLSRAIQRGGHRRDPLFRRSGFSDRLRRAGAVLDACRGGEDRDRRRVLARRRHHQRQHQRRGRRLHRGGPRPRHGGCGRGDDAGHRRTTDRTACRSSSKT